MSLISKFKAFIADNKFVVFLVIVGFIVCALNYSVGTWLSGWDTLHHEFNFSMYLRRDAINGLWREYQGLGTVAGHSHISDIPRQLQLIIYDIFLPKSVLRYLYIFLNYIVGGLGLYLLFSFVIKKFYTSASEKHVEYASFLSGLFYMLNLGTLQTFNVPFEMFTTLYAFLPYIVLFTLKYIFSSENKYLFYLLIVSILVAPSGYASTLFYMFYIMYGALVGVFFVINLIDSKSFLRTIKIHVLPLIVLLLANLFWILPNLYFIFTKSTEVSNTNIKFIFSDEAFYKNKEFGNLHDILLHKNFLFDWKIFNFDSAGFDQVLSPWILHLQNPVVTYIGYIFILVFILGILFSILKFKKWSIPFIILLLLPMLFLFTDNFPAGFIFNFIREHFSILREALRFPYTKFSNVFILSYSLFAGFGFYLIFETIHRFGLKLVVNVLFFAFSFFIIVYSLPAFYGNLINKNLRIKYPDYYFEMFEDMNSLEEGRVAILPIHSFWAWFYYDWGYAGSGFLQFGLKHPIMDRDFDRWNIKNEGFYKEFSLALYSNNKEAFNNVLQKYNIKYVLLDTHMFYPNNAITPSTIDATNNMLSNLQELYTYDNGRIKVYAYTPEPNFDNYYIVSSSTTSHKSFDSIYSLSGDYISYPMQNVQTLPEGYFNRYNINIFDQKYNYETLKTYAQLEDLLPTNIYARQDESKIEFVFQPAFFSEIPNQDSPSVLVEKIDNYNSIYFSSPANVLINLSDIPNSSDYKFISNGLLPKELNLEFYNLDDNSSLSLNYNDPELTECGSTETHSFGYSVTESILTIFGDSNYVCLDYKVPPEYYNINFAFLNVLREDVILYACSENSFFCNKIDDVVSFNETFPTLRYRFKNSVFSNSISVILDSLKLHNVQEVTSRSISIADLWGSYQISNSELTMEPTFKLDSLKKFSTPISYSEENFVDCSETVGDKLFTTSRNDVLISSTDGTACLTTQAYLPYLEYSYYIINPNYNNEMGLPSRVCILGEEIDRCALYTSLKMPQNPLILPQTLGSGKTRVDIINYSIGSFASKNSISREFDAIPIPYKYLDYVFSSEESESTVSKENVYVQDQSYSTGWIPLCGLKPCKAQHILINGWANGWEFDHKLTPEETKNITIIFWPQTLQYIGYLALITLTIVLTDKVIRSKDKTNIS